MFNGSPSFGSICLVVAALISVTGARAGASQAEDEFPRVSGTASLGGSASVQSTANPFAGEVWEGQSTPVAGGSVQRFAQYDLHQPQALYSITIGIAAFDQRRGGETIALDILYEEASDWTTEWSTNRVFIGWDQHFRASCRRSRALAQPLLEAGLSVRVRECPVLNGRSLERFEFTDIQGRAVEAVRLTLTGRGDFAIGQIDVRGFAEPVYGLDAASEGYDEAGPAERQLRAWAYLQISGNAADASIHHPALNIPPENLCLDIVQQVEAFDSRVTQARVIARFARAYANFLQSGANIHSSGPSIVSSLSEALGRAAVDDYRPIALERANHRQLLSEVARLELSGANNCGRLSPVDPAHFAGDD